MLKRQPGDTVSVNVNGVDHAATVASNGSWNLTISGLTDGEAVSAVATATDPAGNTATSAAFNFTVDTTTTESPISDAAVTTGTDNNPYINAANSVVAASVAVTSSESGSIAADDSSVVRAVLIQNEKAFALFAGTQGVDWRKITSHP